MTELPPVRAALSARRVIATYADALGMPSSAKSSLVPVVDKVVEWIEEHRSACTRKPPAAHRRDFFSIDTSCLHSLAMKGARRNTPQRDP